MAGAAAVQPETPSFVDWVHQLVNDAHATEMLVAIASVAVVVWTAGFVVRTFHQPNRGLVAGMNYAQLAFMGALVAAFLTPIALRVVASLFFVQEIWTVTSVFMTWRRPPSDRKYGDQQMLDIFGLASSRDFIGYLVLEAPLVVAIGVIVIWPATAVVLPLLWLALYGSYQIMLYFLYVPAAAQATVASSAPTATVPLPVSMKILSEVQQSILSLIDNTAVTKAVFMGREQDHIEAKSTVRTLQESVFAMGQFAVATQGTQPPAALLASGYLQALSAHRAAAARLYTLVFGVAYQPRFATALLDEVRTLALYDYAAAAGNAQTSQFVANGNDVNVVIKDARLDTITRSFSLSWLGEIYCEEVNTALLAVNGYLANPPRSTSTAAAVAAAPSVSPPASPEEAASS